MTLPKRRGYNLRLRSQDKQCILDTNSLESSQDMERVRATTSVSPPAGNVSADSAYFSPGSSLPAMRTRSSTWVASLRSLLQKQKPHRSANVTVPQGLSGSITAPHNEEELDGFLVDVWSKDVAANPSQATSQYVRKVTELKVFFERKFAEIAQREATYVSEMMYQDETTPLVAADELNADGAMKQVLLEAQVTCKFDELRFRLKQEVAQTILNLRAHYIDTGRRKRNLRPKATRILKQWFECHLDHPYPTEHEKRLLATECEITVEQVTTWFSNKRTRSKSLKTVHGRRSKKA